MQLRDWVLVMAMVAVFLGGTALGMYRVHENTREVREGVRLNEAKRRVQAATSRSTRLKLYRSLLADPGEVREQARLRLGMREIFPADIVPLKAPAGPAELMTGAPEDKEGGHE
jgi:putative ubiquitin-RnfH superfamily antitoxin RatB of RatAB toxin-antitoxin module